MGTLLAGVLGNVTRTFRARILVWSPELSTEKTVLLAVRADLEQHDHLAEVLLESGPVTFDEPGFKWRSQPVWHGLFVWVGSVEIEDDGDFFFDGTWEDPTPTDLSHMAGLSIQQIGYVACSCQLGVE